MLGFCTWSEAATRKDIYGPSHQIQRGVNLICRVCEQMLEVFYIYKRLCHLARKVDFVAQIAAKQDKARVDNLGELALRLCKDHCN